MMDKEEIYPVILDESENMVYLTDLETYEVVYLNRAIMDTLNLQPGETYDGKLCYQLLQGQDAPCSFCTNAFLAKDKFYTWKHFNEKLCKHFSLRDKIIEFDGRPYRMEIGVDITESETIKKELEHQLSIEETLVGCIRILSDSSDFEQSLEELMCMIGEFYQAKRTYIFEYNRESKRLFTSYEWCNEGACSRKDDLNKMPGDIIESWMKHIHDFDAVCLSSGQKEEKKNTLDAEILRELGMRSLMLTPIWKSESVQAHGEKILYGLIGVEGAEREVDHVRLLRSVAFFIYSEIQKRDMLVKLEEISMLDRLTGLGNRNHYMDQLARLRNEKPESLGVVFCDINGLKHANDHYGHAFGDRMIQSVAKGIRLFFPGSAYRIGGDEFVALYENGTKEEFEKRLKGLRDYAKNQCTCDFSMGINFDDKNVDVDSLIGGSDNMMYVEKQLYYSRVLTGKTTHHRAIARQLRAEINAGGFEVFLQPKIDLKTKKMVGAEALLRRREADGSYSLPGQFISLYEKEGVIQLLDCFAFEQVCKILREWIENGGQPVPVAVNFSGMTLMLPEMVESLAGIREKYEIPERLLVLEITQSISRIETETLKILMKEIQKYHFRVSLDDYGYEYSNLAVLSNMDFVELKLDRNLVENLKDNPKTRILVENSIEMCRQLNQVVSTAEGIENNEQLEILKGLNCDVGQGFLFSHPLPKKVFFERFCTSQCDPTMQ